MKREWAREEYTVCYTRNKRSGLAGVWKLRGMRKEFERERCILCSEDDDAVHI
jgi:hypothetical protein